MHFVYKNIFLSIKSLAHIDNVGLTLDFFPNSIIKIGVSFSNFRLVISGMQMRGLSYN